MSEVTRARVAVAAMFIFNGALFGAWASRIPAVQERFDLSEGVLGLLLLALAAGAITAFPLAGNISDRWGAATTTKAVALVYAPAMIIIAWSPTVAVLAVAVFLFGATHGAMDVAMNSWGAEVERAAGRPIMSFLHAMFSVGAGVGAGIGALVASLDLDYSLHLTGFAILAAMLILPARVAWQSVRRSHRARHRLLALPTGGLVIVAMVAFSSSLGEGGMADWSAVYLVDELGAGPGKAALGYAVFSAAMVAMRLIGDAVTRRFGAVATVRMCGAVALAGSLLALFAAVPAAALIGFAMMGIGYAIIMPLVFSRAANDPHVSSGTALAGVATFGYGGMLLGPPLIGFLGELTSLRSAFFTFAVLALFIAVAARAFSDRQN